MTQRYDDQMRITELDYVAKQRRGDPRPRRRLWMIASPLILLLVLAAGWAHSGSMRHRRQPRVSASGSSARRRPDASSPAQIRMSAATRSVSEVSCREPTFELRNLTPELTLSGKFGTVLAQVYDPTPSDRRVHRTDHDVGDSCAGECIGAADHSKPLMSANWSLAQAELARLARRAGAPFSCVRQSSSRADGTGGDGAGGGGEAAGTAQPRGQQQA